MAPGNPFKSSGKGEGGLLGAGGLRSDQWDDQELEQPSPPSGDAAGSGSTAAAATGAAAAPGAAPVAAQRSAAPGYTAAEAPLPPPPPPVATGSFLPPPPPATQPPTVTGVPASTAGAWGAAQPAQQPGVWAVSSSQFDSSGPAGYPPASGYPPPAGGFQPQYGGYGAPSYQAQQWTGGYSDQPLTCELMRVPLGWGGQSRESAAGLLSGVVQLACGPCWGASSIAACHPPAAALLADTTFEQSAGAQQQPMGCWGWGEQWACFIIGILIWPLW